MSAPPYHSVEHNEVPAVAAVPHPLVGARRAPLPEELFLRTFRFLALDDRARAARVCRHWHSMMRQSDLWFSLDLSPTASLLTDGMLRKALQQRQFVMLESLSLEMCALLTPKALDIVAEEQPNLKVLLLTHACSTGYTSHLPVNKIARFCQRMTNLRKIELLGAIEDPNGHVALQLRELLPNIDFGFLFRRALSKTNMVHHPRILPPGAPPDLLVHDAQAEESSTNSQQRLLIPNVQNPRLPSASMQHMEPQAHQQSGPRLGLQPPSSLISDEFSGEFGSDPLTQLPVVALVVLPEHRFNRTSEHDLTAAACAFAENMDADIGNCGGDVHGRLVYDSVSWRIPGKYPAMVHYACRRHRNQVFRGNDVWHCQVCQSAYLANSMATEVTCSLCNDRAQMTAQRRWISLDLATEEEVLISHLSFGNILERTVVLSNRRNLPSSLEIVASVRCTLDVNQESMQSPPSFAQQVQQQREEQQQQVDDLDFLNAPDDGPGEEDEEKEDEPLLNNVDRGVSYLAFWQHNEPQVNLHVEQIKSALLEARRRNNTRALLVYRPGDECDHIDVVVDRRSAIKSPVHETSLRSLYSGWSAFWLIALPILAMSVVLPMLVWMYRPLSAFDSIDNGMGVPAIVVQTRQDTPAYWLPLVVIAGVLAIFALATWMAARHRETCERIFRKFLVVDSMLILSVGTGIILFTLWFALSAGRHLPMDVFAFVFVCWNVGGLGVAALWLHVPSVLPKISVAFLTAIMAFVVTVVLGPYAFVLTTLVAFLDFACWTAGVDWLMPFLSQNIIPEHLTPRLYYQVRGVRVRIFDLMLASLCFGALPLLIDRFVLASLLFTTVFVTSVFAAPLLLAGACRPLPLFWLAFLFMVLLIDDKAASVVRQASRWETPLI
ncbi:MAG: hypothetical protein MHM6MM_002590 [Cercozoa sp. M6MM]